MRAPVAAALLLLAGSAHAQSGDLQLAVENLRLESSAMRAIVRVSNKGARSYASVRVQCAFLVKGRAIDASGDIVQNIAAGETAYAKIIGPIGPEASTVDEARCRIVGAR